MAPTRAQSTAPSTLLLKIYAASPPRTHSTPHPMPALPSCLSLTRPHVALTKMAATGLTNQEHPVCSMPSQTAVKQIMVHTTLFSFHIVQNVNSDWLKFYYEYFVKLSHVMAIHSSYSQTVETEVDGEGSKDAVSELDGAFTTSTPLFRVRTLCRRWRGWAYRGHGVRAFYTFILLYIFIF